jgi:hypothetical protein
MEAGLDHAVNSGHRIALRCGCLALAQLKQLGMESVAARSGDFEKIEEWRHVQMSPMSAASLGGALADRTPIRDVEFGRAAEGLLSRCGMLPAIWKQETERGAGFFACILTRNIERHPRAHHFGFARPDVAGREMAINMKIETVTALLVTFPMMAFKVIERWQSDPRTRIAYPLTDFRIELSQDGRRILTFETQEGIAISFSLGKLLSEKMGHAHLESDG